MPKMVKLASGKNAEVGSSTRVGKYTYQVQADGSVRRSDGKTTAKPTSIKVEVSQRTMPKVSERPAARSKTPPVPVTRSTPRTTNAVRPSGPIPSNTTKVAVNAVRPSGPVSSNKPVAKKIDITAQYGSNSTKKVDVAKMYGSRPAKK